MFERKKKKQASWLDRILALLAVVNLTLVAFDWTYVPWRDFYFRYLPEFTWWYGETFKGMEPNRDTVAYLAAVDALQDAGLDGPETEALLEELRDRSVAMVDENPFALAEKSGTLERIKNEMRDRMGLESSKEAFRNFWDADYLDAVGPGEALAFFDDDIRPLMETNFFRGINERGRPIDLFWRIDLPFMLVFAADFLIRTLGISRKYRGTNWFDAMLWRWYDVPLFIPQWRWLRILPTTIRIQQSRLANLEPIRDRVTRGLTASVAVEMTEVVVLRVIEQLQEVIQRKTLRRLVSSPDPQRRYVDINGVNESEMIAQKLTDLAVYRILPEMRPELEALIGHSVDSVLSQSPVYRGASNLPGFKEMSGQIGDRLVSELTETAYDSLKSALEDEKGAELTQDLVEKFTSTLRTELYQNATFDYIEDLLVDLLEELKINYVQDLSEKDLEALRQETHHRLYQMTQGQQQNVMQPRPMRSRSLRGQ
ncbi:hypothetical protein [Vacuolonema iberomarrocanum]|uniref:hypothetical protein n=1 Tax=Vacuolonema iberomarrocanum TaxID=3454632 RepID=UPI0019DE53DA|nr:hypothetical protein [filamentous cyanobacterium LEGE 07170]